MGPQLTVLIIEVSLFHWFIYTHLYCNGTTTDCPYYRGVLIIEVSLFQSVQTITGLTVLIKHYDYYYFNFVCKLCLLIFLTTNN